MRARTVVGSPGVDTGLQGVIDNSYRGQNSNMHMCEAVKSVRSRPDADSNQLPTIETIFCFLEAPTGLQPA